VTTCRKSSPGDCGEPVRGPDSPPPGPGAADHTDEPRSPHPAGSAARSPGESQRRPATEVTVRQKTVTAVPAGATGTGSRSQRSLHRWEVPRKHVAGTVDLRRPSGSRPPLPAVPRGRGRCRWTGARLRRRSDGGSVDGTYTPHLTEEVACRRRRRSGRCSAVTGLWTSVAGRRMPDG
jgi:hypothetical protein